MTGNDEKEIQKKAEKNMIKTILILATFIIINRYVISFDIVVGNSMKPTVAETGAVITNRLDKNLKRYDLVLAKIKTDTYKKTVIKRVIGLPGDTVQIKNKSIYINGSKIKEYDYETDNPGIAKEKILLEDGQYFLVGDNRKVSYDSRNYGAVNIKNILGTVVKIVDDGE